ncbi:MAG: succinate dehydrogenase, cytochrome b556 subunit [Candidatus Brocadiales bacterium]
METIRQIINEIKLNFGAEVVSITQHRVTGIALVCFLFLHIWTLSAVFQGPEAFNSAASKFNNPAGHFMEYMLLLAVIAHLVNGVRITLIELFDLTAIQGRLLLVSAGVFVFIAGYTINILF